MKPTQSPRSDRSNCWGCGSVTRTLVVVLLLVQLLREPILLQCGIASTNIEWGFTGGDADQPVLTADPPSMRSKVSIYQSKESMCQRLAQIYEQGLAKSANANQPPLSAGTLWVQYFDEVLAASLQDGRNKQETYNLWMDLRPELLDQSLLSPPKAKDIRRIWNILEERRKDPKNAPPLQVLVMGGSVTDGTGCHQKNIDKNQCRWTSRLSRMINELLGFDAVKIHNIATEGTGTNQALSVLKYWMYPKSMQNVVPDIILHSYAPHDSLWANMLPTHSDLDRVRAVVPQVVDAMNNFYEQVLESYSCPISETPIVMFLDDYVGGHGQGAAFGDTLYRMVLAETSSWQGNVAVSYSRIVQKLIWTNPMGESTFSPPWKQAESGRIHRNPHFGWTGHQAITWVWAYSALHAAVDYCQYEEWARMQKDVELSSGLQRKSKTTQQTLELQDEPPPPLDIGTRLEDVADKWKEKTRARRALCANFTSDVRSPPCVMAWIASPATFTSTPDELMSYLDPFLESKNGWKAQYAMGDGLDTQLGLTSHGTKSLLAFSFKDIKTPVRTLTINSVKSPGFKLEGSMVELRVEVINNESSRTILKESVSGMQVLGAPLSHTETFRLDLQGHIPVGSHVRVTVKSMSIGAFKITGMMLCSS